MRKTKIDWCDCTINPVVGCKNGCEYCYARKLNDRFHFVDNWCEPQFFLERLDQLKSKKPKSIFMNSMSDIGLWKDEWINETLLAMKMNPQHKYIFLTKIKYGFLRQQTKFFYGLLDNTYFGITITKQSELEKLKNTEFDFISIEPIHAEIILDGRYIPLSVKCLIIGAETGNRKDKIIPKKEWIDKLVKFADEHSLSVFMKSSLKEIMGQEFRQDKLLWGINL